MGTNSTQKRSKIDNELQVNDSIQVGLVLPIDSEQSSIADPQVKIRKEYSSRRSFSKSYKIKILTAYEACKTAAERGALLRREGLYHSRISAWKLEQASGKSRIKPSKHDIRFDNLTRENDQLKKKLAHAEAIIDLQKKISQLLGDHILPLQCSEKK